MNSLMGNMLCSRTSILVLFVIILNIQNAIKINSLF